MSKMKTVSVGVGSCPLVQHQKVLAQFANACNAEVVSMVDGTFGKETIISVPAEKEELFTGLIQTWARADYKSLPENLVRDFETQMLPYLREERDASHRRLCLA